MCRERPPGKANHHIYHYAMSWQQMNRKEQCIPTLLVDKCGCLVDENKVLQEILSVRSPCSLLQMDVRSNLPKPHRSVEFPSSDVTFRNMQWSRISKFFLCQCFEQKVHIAIVPINKCPRHRHVSTEQICSQAQWTTRGHALPHEVCATCIIPNFLTSIVGCFQKQLMLRIQQSRMNLCAQSGKSYKPMQNRVSLAWVWLDTSAIDSWGSENVSWYQPAD